MSVLRLVLVAGLRLARPVLLTSPVVDAFRFATVVLTQVLWRV